MRIKPLILLSLSLFLLISCATKKHTNIIYSTEKQTPENPLQLNIFTPRNVDTEKLPVLIFVHGGNWNSGKKETYGFLGRNFAKKDVVCVIPDYTLSPNANYDEMTTEIAKAIEWTKTNIEAYGGNPNTIFLTGHSAGGHLVALAATNPDYGFSTETISGVILNDAAGLDMHHYLKSNPPTAEDNYLTTWSNDPEIWKAASPIHYLDEKTPPFMIYYGSKSYASIIEANQRFLKVLQNYQPGVQPIILNKKHVPMVLQYFWPWSKRYNEVIKFIEQVESNK
jgi:acetyl esterase/lipase